MEFISRWLTPHAKHGKSSIHGTGTIAMQDISKNEVVVVYGGGIVSKENILQVRKEVGHLGIQVDNNFFLMPPDRKEVEKTGSMNHSCEPNVGFKGSVVLIALRNIKKGEELVLDYAFCESYFDPFKCNCKSVGCRKMITGDDWKLKELQKEYGDYFPLI